MDANFCIPQLSGKNFSYTRLPKPTFSFAAAPAVSSTYATPACPAEDATAIGRGLDAAQAVAYAPAVMLSAPAFVPPPRVQRSPSAVRNPAAKVRPNPVQLSGTPDEQQVRERSVYRQGLNRRSAHRIRHSSAERARARAERMARPRTYTSWASANDDDAPMPSKYILQGPYLFLIGH